MNVVCVRTLVDLIGKGGPNLLVPSGRFESIHLLVFALFDEISISFFVHLIARSPRVLCRDSHASILFLNPLESLARPNSISWRLEKTPPPLISSRNSRAMDIFRVRFLGDTLLG